MNIGESPLWPYREEIDWRAISELRSARLKAVDEARFKPYREAVEALESLKTEHLDVSQAEVVIGSAAEVSSQQQDKIQRSLKAFIPWKKGPYSFFGNQVDAEWRSDWKWRRIEKQIAPLQGRRIADIGCHNGYFMFRMLQHDPALVVGIEPFVKNYLNFKLLSNPLAVDNVAYELLGVEHMHLFPRFYDTVFCLGILYHHTDPVALLRQIYDSLVPGGELIIDCQGVAGEEPTAFLPAGRYTRGKGFWYLPTVKCLETWVQRTQYTDIKTFFAEPLSVAEQRRTKPWADIDSLQEFLDPNDQSKTVEGYPAPWRIYLKCRKPGKWLKKHGKG